VRTATLLLASISQVYRTSDDGSTVSFSNLLWRLRPERHAGQRVRVSCRGQSRVLALVTGESTPTAAGAVLHSPLTRGLTRPGNCRSRPSIFNRRLSSPSRSPAAGL